MMSFSFQTPAKTTGGLTLGTPSMTGGLTFGGGTTVPTTSSGLNFGLTPSSGFGIAPPNVQAPTALPAPSFSMGAPATSTALPSFGFGGGGLGAGTATPFPSLSTAAITTAAAAPTFSFGNNQAKPATGLSFGLKTTAPVTPSTLPITATTKPGLPATAAPTAGFTLGGSSAPAGFGLGAPAAPATGFGLGAATTATTTALSFALGSAATSATSATSATTATTAGFGLGSSVAAATTATTTASPGFGIAGVPLATAAPTFSLGGAGAATTAVTATTSASAVGATVPATGLAAPTVAAKPPVTPINFLQLEEKIEKWTLELEEQEQVFLNQARQVNEWDRLLLANSDKIVSLNSGVEKVKLEQQQLDHELDFIVAQQRELEECLLPLEKEFAEVTVSDPERDTTFRLAENLNTQLKQMSEDLKEVIEHINEKNKNQDSNDPIVQIGRILNAHMNSLQWVDQNTAVIKQHLDQVGKMTKMHRSNFESSPSGVS